MSATKNQDFVSGLSVFLPGSLKLSGESPECSVKKITKERPGGGHRQGRGGLAVGHRGGHDQLCFFSFSQVTSSTIYANSSTIPPQSFIEEVDDVFKETKNI